MPGFAKSSLARIVCGVAFFCAAADRAARAEDAPPAAQQPAPDKSGYTFFNPTPDSELRAFSPDRPPKADSATTVDAGHFQYETDIVNYSQTNVGGVTTRLYQAFDPVWKFGLTNWADFELQYNGYQNLVATSNATGAVVARGSGFGDVFVKSKINLFGNDGGSAALAVIPYVKIPSDSVNTSNGAVEEGLIAPLQLTLPQDFGMTLMTEVDALKNANDNGRHVNFLNLVNLNHPVPGIKNLSAAIELFSSVGTDPNTPPVYTFDTALIYLLTPNVQLDWGADFGLNRAAPAVQVFMGLSQRF
ncbi:MAG: transporter [Xanthobacteraceae bacterium]|nr:transporter [Xanthobacteraceae bacterium]